MLHINMISSVTKTNSASLIKHYIGQLIFSSQKLEVPWQHIIYHVVA